jgi:hypothetical protein
LETKRLAGGLEDFGVPAKIKIAKQPKAVRLSLISLADMTSILTCAMVAYSLVE